MVTIGENGVTEANILVHDSKCEDPTLQYKLALMEGPDLPVALGIFRDFETETYDEAMVNQIEQVKAKSKIHTFDALVDSLEQWEI